MVGIGPILGAILAAMLYKLLKVLHYEDVNGDQDKCDDETSLLEAQTNRLEIALKKYGPQNWRNSAVAAAAGGARTRPKVSRRDTEDYLRLYRLSELDAYKYDVPYEEHHENVVQVQEPEQKKRLSGIPERIRSI